jgi:hypothetical protein
MECWQEPPLQPRGDQDHSLRHRERKKLGCNCEIDRHIDLRHDRIEGSIMANAQNILGATSSFRHVVSDKAPGTNQQQSHLPRHLV